MSTAPKAPSWYDRVNTLTYGGTGNFQDWKLSDKSLGDYQDGKNNWTGSLDDLTKIVGGLRYLDQEGSTAIDANGTTYQRIGQNKWGTYQSNMGRQQSRYDTGGTFGTYYKGDWGTGKDFHTDQEEGLHRGWFSEDAVHKRDSAAFSVFDQQAAARLANASAPISQTSVVSNTPPPPVANPINHDFINGLRAQISGNTSAALQSSQAQGTQNANQMRLAAGANTLGGDFGAASAAGQNALAMQQQGDVAQANLAQSQAQQQNQGLLAQGLQQQAQTEISNKGAELDQTVTNISDAMESLKQDIGQMSAEQAQQVRAYTDQLSALMQQYKSISTADAQAAQKKMAIAKVILGIGATAAAVATGGASLGVVAGAGAIASAMS